MKTLIIFYIVCLFISIFKQIIERYLQCKNKMKFESTKSSRTAQCIGYVIGTLLLTAYYVGLIIILFSFL